MLPWFFSCPNLSSRLAWLGLVGLDWSVDLIVVVCGPVQAIVHALPLLLHGPVQQVVRVVPVPLSWLAVGFDLPFLSCSLVSASIPLFLALAPLL